MRTFELLRYQVEIDETATRDWYAKADAWGCECGHCRNFLALAEKKDLPVSVMHMLNSLGIPPQKATYVCEMYPDGEGHCYQFGYRIAENILCENKNLAEGEGQSKEDVVTNLILMEHKAFRNHILIWSSG